MEWFDIFGINLDGNRSEVYEARNQGFILGGVPLLKGTVDFALSSEMPDGQLLGFSRGDTLEELVEAGSDIEESERAIQNQSVTIVKTENAGYKLNFDDTREVYDFD